MSKSSVLLAAILLLAGCGGGGDPQPATSGEPPIAQKSQLRREGRWLVDSRNRIVLIHGVNTVWKTPPYAPPAEPAGFVAADADWLRDHGFNASRVGTLFVGVMPAEGVIDHAYLELWDRVIQLLASRGIYTLLDFHQDLYNERYAGEGFPDWATDDNGIPMPVSVGFPGNYFTPACSRAFDNLWSDADGVWARYGEAWAAVAARWKDQDHLMGYDLMNEPWPGTQTATCANPLGCPIFDTQMLQPFQESALGAIRAVDGDNIVWFEPNLTFNSGAQTNLGLLGAPDDANLGLSWHNYCLPAALLHAQGFDNVPGCDVLHQLVFDNAETAIGTLGSTTLITEFGATDDLIDLDQVVSQADAQLTGWMYWHYKEWADPTTESGESGGQGLFADDADLSTVKVEKLQVLERAYPMATSGVPLELSFDPSNGAFSYRYSPRPATGPTEIHMPAIHYPNGYRVEVTGATVISAPNATTLLLQDLPGAQEVTVAYQPSGAP